MKGKWFQVVCFYLLYSWVAPSEHIETKFNRNVNILSIHDQECIQSLQESCKNVHAPEKVISLLSSTTNQRHEGKRFHFISAFTSNIMSYAVYASVLNCLYVYSHQDYSIQIIEENENFELYKQLDPDARWNKILYLIKAIEDSQASVNRPEWFIWLDADLILVDFGFTIEEILIQVPATTEIIMSKDKASTSFIANSGFIIVRNSLWSLQFLLAWWNTYDRRTCCDQNALTWLYQRKIPFPDVQEKLIFLNADVINTNFPSWENHHENCSVLHLAGLSSLYRRKIFQFGFETVCATVEDVGPNFVGEVLLPSQLNINKELLRISLIELNQLRVQALDSLLASIHQEPLLDTQKVKRFRQILDDIMKYEDDENSWIEKYYREKGLPISTHHVSEQEIANRVYQVRLLIYEYLANQNRNISEQFPQSCPQVTSSVDLSENSTCLQYLRSIQDTITSGFEILLSIESTVQHSSLSLQQIEKSRNLLAFIKFLCEYIYQRIRHPELEKQFLYYLFKHHQFLNALLSFSDSSSTCSDPSMIQQDQIQLLSESVGIWELLIHKYHYYGTQYVLADPEKEYIEVLRQLGVLLCSTGNAREGIVTLTTAIEKHVNMIEGYTRIYITTNDIIRNAQQSFVEMNYNLGLCLQRAGQYPDAKKKLQNAIELFETLNLKTEAYHQAKRLFSSLLDINTLLPEVFVPNSEDSLSKKKKFRKKKKP